MQPNNQKSFQPSQRTSATKKIDNFLFDQIITQHPDEENLIQDILTSSKQDISKQNNLPNKDLYGKHKTQSNQFSSLTQSQKTLEIQKIYQQSPINSFLLEIHSLIENSQQQVNRLAEKQPTRMAQLQIYNKQLQQLTDMLKSSMGSTDEIKIFTSKKVLMILKTIGKFKQKDEYDSLIDRVNRIAGIMEKNNPQIKIIPNVQISSHYDINSHTMMIKNDMRRKKKAMTLSLRLENKLLLNFQNQQQNQLQEKIGLNYPLIKPIKSTLSQDEQKFQQILQRVDQIHEKHLQTWQNQRLQMKQLQEKRKLIKLKYSSFYEKSNPNRPVLRKHSSTDKFFSLLNNRNDLDYQQEKDIKKCFDTLETQVSRRLSNSLPALNKEVKVNPAKKQNEFKVQLDSAFKRKSSKLSLELRRNSKRSQTMKSSPSIKKSRQSLKNRSKFSKQFDEIIQSKNSRFNQVKSRSLSKQRTLLKSSNKSQFHLQNQNKNNSVQESHKKNLSPLKNNNRKSTNQKQIKQIKLNAMKNINLHKNKKLKII